MQNRPNCGPKHSAICQPLSSQAVGVKNVGKLLSSMPLYEIESAYVDAAAAARFGLDLDAAPLPCEALDDAGIKRLMAACDHLLGF